MIRDKLPILLMCGKRVEFFDGLKSFCRDCDTDDDVSIEFLLELLSSFATIHHDRKRNRFQESVVYEIRSQHPNKHHLDRVSTIITELKMQHLDAGTTTTNKKVHQ